MRKRVIRFSSTILIVTLLVTSCMSGSDPEVKEVVPPLAETVVVAPKDEEAVVETVVVVAEEAESEAETLVENLDPTATDAALFESIVGGFFYSNESDGVYNDTRKKSIHLLNVELRNLTGLMETWYYSGLDAYESQLLFFIDDVDPSRQVYKSYFDVIINSMIVKKAEIEGYFQALEALNDLAKKDLATELNKAVLDGERFKVIVSLFQALEEYEALLIWTSEAVASEVVDNFNAMYADVVRDYTNTAYLEHVISRRSDALKSYLVMTNMYAHIASADYYNALEIRRETISQLIAMEQTQEVKYLLETLSVDLEKPDYLIEIFKNEDSLSFNLPFVITAYADDIDTYTMKVVLADMLKDIQNERQVFGELTTDDMQASLFDILLMQKKLKDTIVKNYREKNLNADRNYLGMSDKEIEAEAYEHFLEWGTNKASFSEMLGDTEEEKPLKIKIAAVKKEIISQRQRAEIIEKMKDARDKGTKDLSPFLLSLGTTFASDILYDKIIKGFTDVLKEKKDGISPQIYGTLNDLFDTQLSEILGSKKEDFVTQFMTGSIDDVVNKFADWVNTSRNRKDLKINKNDIIEALDAMGIAHDALKEPESDSSDDVIDQVENTDVDSTDIDESNYTTVLEYNAEGDWRGKLEVLGINASGDLTQEERANINKLVGYTIDVNANVFLEGGFTYISFGENGNDYILMKNKVSNDLLFKESISSSGYNYTTQVNAYMTGIINETKDFMEMTGDFSMYINEKNGENQSVYMDVKLTLDKIK